jgi:TPR repeat protein
VLRSALIQLVLAVPAIGLAIAAPKEQATVPGSQDAFEAVQVLRAFADQGRAQAQFMLGGLYFTGKSVPRDYVEASNWFRKAAWQGDPNAAHSLGSLYA